MEEVQESIENLRKKKSYLEDFPYKKYIENRLEEVKKEIDDVSKIKNKELREYLMRSLIHEKRILKKFLSENPLVQELETVSRLLVEAEGTLSRY